MKEDEQAQYFILINENIDNYLKSLTNRQEGIEILCQLALLELPEPGDINLLRIFNASKDKLLLPLVKKIVFLTVINEINFEFNKISGEPTLAEIIACGHFASEKYLKYLFLMILRFEDNNDNKCLPVCVHWKALGEALKIGRITSLELFSIHLDVVIKHWEGFINAIKISDIQSLELAGEQNARQLQTFAEIIKCSGISSLKLSDIALNKLNKTEWDTLIQIIKYDNIQSISIKDCHLRRITQEQCLELLQALTHDNRRNIALDDIRILPRFNEKHWRILNEFIKKPGVLLSLRDDYFYNTGGLRTYCGFIWEEDCLFFNFYTHDYYNYQCWKAILDIAININSASKNLHNESDRLSDLMRETFDNENSSLDLKPDFFSSRETLYWKMFSTAVKLSGVTEINLPNSPFYFLPERHKELNDICNENLNKRLKLRTDAIVKDPKGKLVDLIRFNFFKKWNVKTKIASNECSNSNNNNVSIEYEANGQEYQFDLTPDESEILLTMRN